MNSRILTTICIGILLPGTHVSACAAAEVAIAAELHAKAVQQLFAEEWQRTLRENPTHASELGDRRYNRLWRDASIPAAEQRLRQDRDILQRLQRIDRKSLDEQGQLNCRLFERQLEQSIADASYRLFLLPVNQREGIQDHSSLADLLQFDSIRDYEDWIARMRAFPLSMAQTMALMKQGMRERMLHPRIVMQRIPAQIRKQLVSRSQDSLYYKPFRTFRIELTGSEQVRLRQLAISAIEECILPSYRVFLAFFEQEYLPASFAQVGCWQRPNGQAMYAMLARSFTTTSLTPQEIHHLGLQEVDRIRQEMEVIQRQIGYSGSFQEFLSFLRTDRQFYFQNPDDLLNAYRECCQRIDPELSKLFRKLPTLPYQVLPVPAQLAPDTTTAYYQAPAADGSRPGSYYVNLYRPEERPKYEIEALTLHESVPGHHLQIALSMECENLPEFRRYSGPTAFVEGWGLYSEKLGEELGMYRDPYSKFGQLTYEMWRAVRLVVDTGIHSLKWDRQQAVDYFAANTAKSLLDIENEVDRYIAWPGQALAYKVGELKFRELRLRAERVLGERFDVREFHDVVLGNGAVPLDVLEELVSNWLSDKVKAALRDRGNSR